MHLFYLIAGTVAMVVGADYSVRTSLKLAQRWGWPDWVAGMLLLALGTSLPELFVSLSSVAEHPHLSLGNLMGSNLFNVAVVLGVCLLIKGKHRFQVESIEWPSLMPLIIGSVFVFMWFYYPPSQSSSSLFLIAGLLEIAFLSWHICNMEILRCGGSSPCLTRRQPRLLLKQVMLFTSQLT